MKILIYARVWAVIFLFIFFIQKSTGQIEWKRIPFPDTTFIHFIEDLNDSIFVGTETGLFLSLDQGNTWDTLLVIPNITSIANFKQQIYVGSSFHGVFRSSDTETWEPISEFETQHTRSLLSTGNDLFLSTSRNIFRWDEAILNWEKATLNNQCIHNKAIHGIFQVANELYSVGSNYIYKSNLIGEEWILVKGSYANQSLKAKELIYDQIVFSSGTEMFAIGGDSLVHFSDFNRPDTNTFVKDFIRFDSTLVYISGEEILLPDGNFYNICNSDLTTLTTYNNSIWVGSMDKGIWVIEGKDLLEIRSTSLADIKIYPNPSDGNITVSLSFDPYKTCVFNIISLDGKIVYTEYFNQHKMGSINRQINIDIPGSYIATLDNQGQKRVTHFIIQ